MIDDKTMEGILEVIEEAEFYLSQIIFECEHEVLPEKVNDLYDLGPLKKVIAYHDTIAKIKNKIAVDLANSNKQIVKDHLAFHDCYEDLFI